MAYNDYSMGGYIPGDYETEEDRKRRLAAEQAQYQAQDQESGGITAQRPSLGDLASQYIGRRVDTAMTGVNSAVDMVQNPQAALERRLGMPEQPDAANTEVQSQQVKTYADGSQEHVVKTQTPAPAPQAPVAMAPQPAMAPAPQQQQAPAPQPQQQQAPAQGMAAQMAPSGPAVPTVERQAEPGTPQMAALPQAGPGVQVAGPVNPATATQPAPVVQQAPAGAPGASLAQAGQAALVQPTRPQWAIDLETAGTDQTRLIDIAANKSYPQDVRDDAKAKLRTAMASADAATEAEKTVTAAAQGDPRAQQKLLNSIKSASVKKEAEGPVTEGSYIRAYLYARLGLNDLAKEEQEKILGRSKFGQVTVNGQSFEVETDPRSGRVMLARDSEGNRVDAPILNKIRAEAAKFGTHAYGFTGGSLTIPPSDKENSGQEYRQRTNSITGQIENVITTGPNAGKLYTGAPGFEKRVETNAAVKLNDAYIDFQTKPTIAMATTMLELAGKADKGDGKTIANAMAEIQRRSPGIFQQVQPLAASITAQGAAAPGGAPATTAGTVRPGATTTAPGGAPATTAPGAGGGGSLLQQTTGQVESIKTAEEIKRAELKPPAEAKGKNEAKDINNQRYSNETYGLIRPISDAIKQSTGSGLGTKVDQLAGVFGVGTTGAQAKAQLDVLGYNLVSNVPRFEGAQSDRDVALYERAAGDIANSEKPVSVRLAALNTIVQMLKKYDKAGANDWSFGTARPGGEIKIISREKVQ